jgi:hypothetical protein
VPFLSPVFAQTLPEVTIVTKIASMTQPIPRGTVIGERVGVRPIDGAEHFFRCEAFGGRIHMRDLAQVFRTRNADPACDRVR